MKHKYIEPEDCESCQTPSDYPRSCNVCDGGLAICRVCGLAEGCLTTDCPGEDVYVDRHDDVYSGKIDYRNGQWVEACTPHSPAAYR